MSTFILSLLVACSPGNLDGEYGFNVAEAWLFTCVQDDGTSVAIAYAEGRGRAEECKRTSDLNPIDALDSRCDSWTNLLTAIEENEGENGCADWSFSPNRESVLQANLYPTDLQDLVGAQTSQVYSYSCTGLEMDPVFDHEYLVGDSVYLTGSAEISEHRGDKATLVVETDELEGELTLKICEG